MTKHERIFNLLEGKDTDRPPVGFWLHFPDTMHHGEAAIQAHINFMEETDTDILKIMNENILYDGESIIATENDIHKFRGFSRKDKIFKDQMEIIKRIADYSKGRYPIAATIHGLLASAFHETGFSGQFTTKGGNLAQFCRSRPREMKQVFEIITQTLMEFSDCSLEAGAEGIFYAALGGERHFFQGEEFEEFVAPFEQKIYAHIKNTTKFDILHICKANIDFNRYVDLHPSIVNWGVNGNQFSLSDGARLFQDSIILGGFPDRHGVLVDGTQEEIVCHTREILEQMKGHRLIIGADCTLPTEISHERIRWVVNAVEGEAYGR
ncbi:uroporphyrinogen decarboxylase family protein [Clostridium sp. MCC353]|uniref:uroporphyrinogen decarboxylase family protein n=1 Tax=Clostridium sp. MCC353 TaxID=2592646 RepID=UPI002079D7D2|nr:uroporphyrinogen decarboxylase family protein [Clostridium sp. MCC353]